MEFVRVGRVEEVPSGSMKGFVANGKKLLVANVKGRYFAIGSVCTHAGGPLDKGSLDGNIVTCPWHGSKFNVSSGEVAGPPASKGEAKYEVRIEGQDILVGI